MADSPEKDDRTEEPTQRKLDDAIAKGDVAKSIEINTLFVLGGFTLALMLSSGAIAERLALTLRGFLMNAHQVPAGGALAVDRDGFSAAVTAALKAHPLVSIERGEVAGMPPEEWSSAIVATGPLTSPALAEAILRLTGERELAFFDAIAPIVYRESVDMGVAWFQSRYD